MKNKPGTPLIRIPQQPPHDPQPGYRKAQQEDHIEQVHDLEVGAEPRRVRYQEHEYQGNPSARANNAVNQVTDESDGL